MSWTTPSWRPGRGDRYLALDHVLVGFGGVAAPAPPLVPGGERLRAQDLVVGRVLHDPFVHGREADRGGQRQGVAAEHVDAERDAARIQGHQVEGRGGEGPRGAAGKPEPVEHVPARLGRVHGRQPAVDADPPAGRLFPPPREAVGQPRPPGQDHGQQPLPPERRLRQRDEASERVPVQFLGVVDDDGRAPARAGPPDELPLEAPRGVGGGALPPFDPEGPHHGPRQLPAPPRGAGEVDEIALPPEAPRQEGQQRRLPHSRLSQERGGAAPLAQDRAERGQHVPVRAREAVESGVGGEAEGVREPPRAPVAPAGRRREPPLEEQGDGSVGHALRPAGGELEGAAEVAALPRLQLGHRGALGGKLLRVEDREDPVPDQGVERLGTIRRVRVGQDPDRFRVARQRPQGGVEQDDTVHTSPPSPPLSGGRGGRNTLLPPDSSPQAGARPRYALQWNAGKKGARP